MECRILFNFNLWDVFGGLILLSINLTKLTSLQETLFHFSDVILTEIVTSGTTSSEVDWFYTWKLWNWHETNNKIWSPLPGSLNSDFYEKVTIQFWFFLPIWDFPFYRKAPTDKRNVKININTFTSLKWKFSAYFNNKTLSVTKLTRYVCGSLVHDGRLVSARNDWVWKQFHRMQKIKHIALSVKLLSKNPPTAYFLTILTHFINALYKFCLYFTN